MKKIIEMTDQELHDDYNTIIKLQSAQANIEAKYEKLGVNFGTVYGIKKSILEELGRRSMLTLSQSSNEESKE